METLIVLKYGLLIISLLIVCGYIADLPDTLKEESTEED